MGIQSVWVRVIEAGTQIGTCHLLHVLTVMRIVRNALVQLQVNARTVSMGITIWKEIVLSVTATVHFVIPH
jgi:hypothetical protein